MKMRSIFVCVFLFSFNKQNRIRNIKRFKTETWSAVVQMNQFDDNQYRHLFNVNFLRWRWTKYSTNFKCENYVKLCLLLFLGFFWNPSYICDSLSFDMPKFQITIKTILIWRFTLPVWSHNMCIFCTPLPKKNWANLFILTFFINS